MMGRLYNAAVMILLLLFLATQTIVSAQQAPSLTTEKFDNTSNHRTDLCEATRQLYAGNTTLKHALWGLELSVVLTDYTDPTDKLLFALNKDGVIDPNRRPLFAKILDELGSRAGFTWRNSFGVVAPIDSQDEGNRSYTEL